MDLACPRCGAGIASASINVERLVAKCDACAAVFSFEGQVARPVAPRRRVACPRNIRIAPSVADTATTELGAGLAQNYRQSAREGDSPLRLLMGWFRFEAIFLAFFSLFWCGFLVVWYAIAFSMSHTPLMMFLFPLLHVGVGVGMAYSALAMFVNTTTIEVTKERLTVKHGPLYWIGEIELDARSIDQLFIRETRHRSKNGRYYRYAVCADCRGTIQDVIKGLRSENEARFIEQSIEEKLAILDDPSADVFAR